MPIRKLIGLAIAFAGCSFAGAITMTHTGVGSGQIGATVFTDASFVITDVGDTTARQSFGSGFFIDDISASIAISGVGTFSFTTATRSFVNNGGSIVGFSRAGADLFNGPINAAFATWDMLSSIGPIAGTGSLLQWAITPVNTDGGVLVFSNSVSDSIFTATVGNSIPEPATGALVGAVAAVLFGLARRRQKRPLSLE